MSLPQPPDSHATLALLERLKSGEREAAGEIYRRYHDELLLYVRARLGSKLRSALESEDVLQSVALEAVRALPGFEPRGDDSLRRFLHTLVLNKIRDRADTYGAAKRQGGVPLTESLLGSVAAPAGPPSYHDEVYLRLERCLLSLPDEMREAIELRRIEGLSSREAAARMGRSDDAMRKLYSRALARLTLAMEGPGEA